jgi:hypothetical protein
VNASGAPQNNPIGVFLDEETGNIVVGGHAMGATRKFRNVQANAQVAQPRDIGTRPAVNRVARHEISPAARVSRIDRTVRDSTPGSTRLQQVTIDAEAEPKAPQYLCSSGSSCDPGGRVAESRR